MGAAVQISEQISVTSSTLFKVFVECSRHLAGLRESKMDVKIARTDDPETGFFEALQTFL